MFYALKFLLGDGSLKIVNFLYRELFEQLVRLNTLKILSEKTPRFIFLID